MTDPDIHAKILRLLKRGPYMKLEIFRFCQPDAPEDVQDVLREMQRRGTIRFLKAVSLYALV